MSLSDSSIAYSFWNVVRDSKTFPLTVFFPTMIQPAESTSEMRYIVQIWHFFLVLGAVLKGNFISPGRNGSLGIDLFLAGTGTAARSIRTGCRKFPHGIFDGITEKFAVDGQVTYGIGLTFEFAVECQLHTSILFVSKE